MPRTWRRSSISIMPTVCVSARTNSMPTALPGLTRPQSKRCRLMLEICMHRAPIMTPNVALSRRVLTRPPNTCQSVTALPDEVVGTGGEGGRDSTLDVLVVCFTPVAHHRRASRLIVAIHDGQLRYGSSQRSDRGSVTLLAAKTGRG